MRIVSGSTDRCIFVVARDATTGERKTGLASSDFTVWSARDAGGSVESDTPDIVETDSVNMRGVYQLRLKDNTEIEDESHQVEQMITQVTASGMNTFLITVELYKDSREVGSSMAREIHTTGSFGYAIEHVVRNPDGSVKDITGASSVKMIFSRPADSLRATGTPLEVTATIVDATAGSITYTRQDGDFNDVGEDWRRSAKIDNYIDPFIQFSVRSLSATPNSIGLI